MPVHSSSKWHICPQNPSFISCICSDHNTSNCTMKCTVGVIYASLRYPHALPSTAPAEYRGHIHNWTEATVSDAGLSVHRRLSWYYAIITTKVKYGAQEAWGWRIWLATNRRVYVGPHGGSLSLPRARRAAAGGGGLGILVRRSGAALHPLVPAGRPARRSQRITGALI